MPPSLILHRALALLAAVCGGAAPFCHGEEPPAAEPVLLVDGKHIPIMAGEARIPASHRTVSFRLGRPAQQDPERCRRMRFQLEGVDDGWRQIASEMCMLVRFIDARGDQVGQRLFPVDGSSTGWHGTVENSAFTRRAETVRVPAGAAFVTVAVSSSGPPTALGIYAVRGLKITADAGRVLYQTPAKLGTEAAGWSRSGTRPSMAKIVPTAGGDALCLLDEDPGAHAEWSLARSAAPVVVPGEMLTVEWPEMYNVGMGNRFDVNYGQLSAGTYVFMSEELETAGLPLAALPPLTLTVLQPLWKSAWFWLCMAAGAGLMLWLAGRALIRWRIRQHLARVERERLLERERLRIARDLHDDLGARLTHISLVSGLAENDAHNVSARESFQRISGMARELVAALYQTVWTVNPEHDHLEALVDYLCQLTQNLCEPARLRCRIHTCEVPGRRPVRSEVRHHITLAVKEALHNAIKHAAATEITLRLEFADPRLQISIIDNGQGFDPAQAVEGNGLDNLRRRMAAIGGTLAVQSVPGQGTTVCFVVPVAPPPSAGHTALP